MRQALIVENPKWERFADASEKFKALSGDAVLVVRGRSKEKNPKTKHSEVFKKSPEDAAQYAAELRKTGIPASEIAELRKSFQPGEQTKPKPETAPKKGVQKSNPETAEALAADLRKDGAKPEEIEKAMKKFKPKSVAAVVAILLIGLLSLATPANAQQNVTSKLPATSLAAASTNYTGNGTIGWNIDDVLVFQFNVQSANNIHVSTKSNVLVYLDTCLAGSTWSTNQYLISVPTHTYQTNELVTLHRITNSVGGQNLRFGAIWNANTNIVTINSAYVLKKEN